MASFYLKCVFKKLLIRKIKTLKEKNEQEKQQQFFSEELLQEIFSNLHVGQYNLLSHFTTKEKTNCKERRIIVVPCEQSLFDLPRSVGKRKRLCERLRYSLTCHSSEKMDESVKF